MGAYHPELTRTNDADWHRHLLLRTQVAARQDNPLVAHHNRSWRALMALHHRSMPCARSPHNASSRANYMHHRCITVIKCTTWHEQVLSMHRAVMYSTHTQNQLTCHCGAGLAILMCQVFKYCTRYSTTLPTWGVTTGSITKGRAVSHQLNNTCC